MAIPASCEDIARPVMVRRLQEGDDAVAHLARTRAALGIANRTIARVKNCIGQVRTSFQR
jgi:hypothetical protein